MNVQLITKNIGPAVAREAAILVAGAVLAAVVMAAFPGLRDWIAAQWGDAKSGGCSCKNR